MAIARDANVGALASNRTASSKLGDFDVTMLGRALGVRTFRMESDADVARVIGDAAAAVSAGDPVLVDVAIDYSERTYFTRGVVRTHFLRLPWSERMRLVGRALMRRVR